MLENLRPKSVFKYFEEVCNIPHGSGNTGPIASYLENFAIINGLDCVRDEADNVVIYKDASPGYEDAKRVILQGHSDMVCEKADDISFDFESEPLSLKVDGDLVSADGTTLGGDDGIAVAMILAILEDNNLVHGPLSAMITSNEEIGMLGAQALNKSHFSGECYMLNLDSEEEGHFLTSCAGGATIEGRKQLGRFKKEGQAYEISISGLSGGHSGTQIHRGSANAIKLMFALLSQMRESMPFDIISVEGGSKDNAIPKSAKVKILSSVQEDDLCDIISDLSRSARRKYADTDPGMEFTVHPMGRRFASVMVGIQNILEYFCNVPNGVQEMSPDVEGLVLTSLNAGVLKASGDELLVTHSIRSGEDKKRDGLIADIKARMEACGIESKVDGIYPAWEHKRTSLLRDVVREITSSAGMNCVFEGIHAGLEAGLFYQANRSLDIVSFGPNIYDIHTTEERMSISSVERCYDMLIRLLDRLAR